MASALYQARRLRYTACMQAVTIIAVFLAGIALGGLAAWLAARAALARTRQTMDAGAASTKAVLEERLQFAAHNEEAARRDLEQARTEARALSDSLRAESERRSSAEAKAARVEGLERHIEEAREENAVLAGRLSDLTARMEEERKAAQEKLALVDEARVQLSDAFKALSAEALKSNNEQFLELANTSLKRFQETARGDLEARQKAINEMVKPVGESLKGVDAKLQALEKERHAAYQGLVTQVKSLGESHNALRDETARLVTALRKPQVRGRWGEIQLRNVVEMAGMSRHCDFTEQTSVTTEDGRLRPDLVVSLPGGKTLVVDAKAPLDAYLDALEAQDETAREGHLHRHAVQIRRHMSQLGTKGYWSQFDSAPDFVVMFLPGETFFSAALEQSPGLIEEGVSQRVIIASPTTLIAMLKAVSYGWQQEKMAESAREVGALGKDLYERLSVLAAHFARVGKGLDSAVGHYNKAVSSLETRVLVTARKFKDLGVGSKKDIDDVPQVETMARELQAAEIANDGDQAEALPTMAPLAGDEEN